MGDSTKIVVRQPPEFKLNGDQDFVTWYAQFKNFASAVKIDDKEQFKALVTYLDSSAFTLVSNIKIEDATMQNPDLFKPILEKALKNEDELPARLALKYRVQEQKESLTEYATALSKLALKAALPDTTKEQTLVDAFCTGVRNTDLSVKLLESQFATLSLALEQSLKIQGASNIRKLVRPNTSSSTGQADIEILAADSSERASNSNNGAPSSNRSYRPTNEQIPFSNSQSMLNPSAPNFNPDSNHMGQRNPYRNGQGQRFGRYGSSGNAYRPNNNNGHYQPHRQDAPNMHIRNNGSQKRCWYCNRPGHISRNCHKRARETRQQNFRLAPGPRQ